MWLNDLILKTDFTVVEKFNTGAACVWFAYMRESTRAPKTFFTKSSRCLDESEPGTNTHCKGD